MENELGVIAPGKCADIVLLDDLKGFSVFCVFIDGEKVACGGRAAFDPGRFEYPAWALDTMNLAGNITPESFAIKAPNPLASSVKVRTIKIIPERVGTIQKIVDLPILSGLVQADATQDVLKAFVFERHRASGSFGVGFVKGFGIKDGALASTVAHDAHNLLVMGADDADMAIAANALIASGGGMAAALGGKIIEQVALPVCGLMGMGDALEMATQVENLEAAWRAMGCEIKSPFMTMALISLACLPELRLTNRGLVDCVDFKFVDWVL